MVTAAVQVQGGRFAQLTETTALFMADEDTLPPTVCPDYIPAGWQLATDEPLDFEFTNGDWREVYILERADG